MSLISLTYMLSFMYVDTNRAFRSIGVIYLLIGTFVANFVANIVVFTTQSATAFKIVRYVMLANPFWNLNMAMQNIMLDNFANYLPEDKRKEFEETLDIFFPVRVAWTCVFMVFFAAFYFTIAVLIDSKKMNAYRTPENRAPLF
jgi:hypothetical protein